MKTYISIFFCILCFSTIRAQKVNSSSKGIPTKWKTFTQANYSIQYPPEWELDESGLMGSSFILFQPLESKKDLFRENVNLLIQDLSGYDMDLNQFASISEEQVKSIIPNSTLLESKRISPGPEEYHRMIYSGDQGDYHLMFVQYYWVKEKNAFVLTFTCEQDKYESNKETGRAILDSFVFKR